jgi:hypothetical protein
MALPEVLAAGQDWYPKASDLCAEYTIKLGKQDPRFGRLVTPTKDPAIAKYVADFNAATGTNDEGGLALLALVGYCNAHAMTKLGDVTAKIVREHFAAKQGSMIQPAPAESLTRKAWYEQSLSICASSDECRRMVKKTYDDSVACSAGDRSACSAREGNLAEIERYNAQRRNPAAQAIPQDALMSCLQSTAGAVVARCKETKCDPALLVDIIGEVQKIRCGYYAVQPIQ